MEIAQLQSYQIDTFLFSVHHGNKSFGQPDCVAGKEEGDRHKSDQSVDQLRRDHRQLGLERARVKHLKYIFSRLLSNVW